MYDWQLSMASFRFCETYLLHINPFVVDKSAISPFLGGVEFNMNLTRGGHSAGPAQSTPLPSVCPAPSCRLPLRQGPCRFDQNTQAKGQTGGRRAPDAEKTSFFFTSLSRHSGMLRGRLLKSWYKSRRISTSQRIPRKIT